MDGHTRARLPACRFATNSKGNSKEIVIQENSDGKGSRERDQRNMSTAPRSK